MNVEAGRGRFPGTSRRAIAASPEQMVRFGTFAAVRPLPLVLEPALRGVDVYAWVAAHRDLLASHLLQHGALLFRGFDLATAADFHAFVSATGAEPLPYQERSSPRQEVGKGVYTSTDYPATQSIFPHHEHSYKRTFPLHLYFFCERPAESGGATPLVDGRRVRDRLRAATRRRFEEKGWMYVRCFDEHLGLTWRQAFQTDRPDVVEAYCREQQVEWEWTDDGRLRTRQVRPALARHPRTGEMLWFNHATFFHVTTLPAELREVLGRDYPRDELPNNTYYGDGSEIEPGVLDELRDAYQQESITFEWRQGDVLLIDNMIAAHARAPYAGDRRVLVAMATAVTRDDL